ncbi:MAG TPA: hypothetical protein VF132_09825 [Rudaea sp.]
MKRLSWLAAVAGNAVFSMASAATGITPPLPNPILFVTQVPMPGDDVARSTVTSTFANHLPTTAAAPRGGDLMRMAPDGTRRNLTAEAGFGSTGGAGFQDANAIAVRDPAVHWSGTKAIFSMVVGAPAGPGGAENYTWQLYEVTGIGNGEVASITKVPNQPAGFNNIYPNYLSDGSIVFVSDRPRNGAPHLYPINDEYRGQPATSGVWRLDPASGALALIEPTPSGSFSPFVDSFGRVAFVRWDHLMQDNNHTSATPPFPVFDYASEAANAATQAAVELYPEPINAVAGSHLNGFEINQFFPWTVNQDGTREEILNHIGRHELKPAFNRSYNNDASLVDFNAASVVRANPNSIFNFFQMREDPAVPGRYVGVDAMEFGTHASGQIVAINAAQSGALLNAENMTVQYVTNRATSSVLSNVNNIGHFRDPLPMSDGTAGSEGTLLAAFAATPGAEPSPGGAQPVYQFRLNRLTKNRLANGDAVNGTVLTGGIAKTVSYYVGATLVTYSGNLWEIEPVEIRARSAPAATAEPALAAPEQAAFAAAGVTPSDLRAFLTEQNLALLVIRNATTRDDADRQQPFDLRVPGGIQTLGDGGLIYDIAEMQFFEGDQVRGNGTPANPLPGRRTMTRYLNDAAAVRFNPAGAVNAGAQPIAADGSVALFVPARRAMTWQSLSPNAASALPANSPVVRERYWIEYQPGEMRACDGCHGVNTTNQAGAPPATNTPQALIDLLTFWKAHDDRIFADDFDP